MELPFAGGVTLAGLYAHVTPVGRPVHDKFTALLKPPVDVTVHVLVPFPPCTIFKLDGLHWIRKSGVGDDDTVMITLAWAVAPSLSVTVTFDVNVPPLVYV